MGGRADGQKKDEEMERERALRLVPGELSQLVAGAAAAAPTAGLTAE